jgi:putative nucleotidyltransferase with HDIG domain
VNKILVMDDDSEIVDLISAFLTPNGYDVRTLTTPLEGSALFRTFAPDLCLLDFRMPVMTGADVFQQFKAIDPLIEVIFLTGETETERAVDLMKAGAIDYLLKPVNFGQLLAAVARALEHRRLVQENLAYRHHLEVLVEQKTRALNEVLRSLGVMHAATIDALGLALDFRDQSTSGHSQRVAKLTAAIAQKIGITGEMLLEIEQGAFLHDIGKLRIPDGILLKPGPLDASEWTTMRCHPSHGRDFLQKVEFLKGAAQIVYTHHEKFDGSGYPQGLRGEEIPIGTRCFAIVDAVDAMIYKRPYNRPLSFEQAADEILRCAGFHFDPELVGPALEHLSKSIAVTSFKIGA